MQKIIKDKKDYGEWTLPRSWEEVTLSQLLALEGVTSPIKIISVLSGRGEDEVAALPVQFADAIVSELGWLALPPEVEPSASCVIDGETYRVNVSENLSLGEFVAVQSVRQADPNDIATVLAIVCRRAGEAYDIEFENGKVAGRREMFLSAPCTEALKVVGFFLTLWSLSEGCSPRCSQMKEEALNLTRENIETLRKGTDGIGLWSRRRAIRRLRALEKHIRTTY